MGDFLDLPGQRVALRDVDRAHGEEQQVDAREIAHVAIARAIRDPAGLLQSVVRLPHAAAMQPRESPHREEP